MGKLRFKIVEDGNLSFTEWVDESIQHAGPQSTAAQAIARLREEHPNAAISIERDVKPTVERPALIRFRIDVVDKANNNATFYSKAVPEADAETLREQVESDDVLKPFKKKTLTKESVNG
jgi:hypothetical protein